MHDNIESFDGFFERRNFTYIGLGIFVVVIPTIAGISFFLVSNKLKESEFVLTKFWHSPAAIFAPFRMENSL